MTGESSLRLDLSRSGFLEAFGCSTVRLKLRHRFLLLFLKRMIVFLHPMEVQQLLLLT